MMHSFPLLLALVQDGGEAAPPAGLFGGSFLFPLLLVFAIFYFLVMRPEKRNRLRHQQMLAALQKGDKVITTGGMYATVVALGEGTVTLQIADGVRAKFAMAAIQGRVEEAAAAE
jgi:preprotein translocase subunit YajC